MFKNKAKQNIERLANISKHMRTIHETKSNNLEVAKAYEFVFNSKQALESFTRFSPLVYCSVAVWVENNEILINKIN